ncbi:PilZ domain-containing protein [Aneurinibacillus terranovensis]|uniref:PilZ domain-containing protein n=1 Tax=Aneurinibacillus terranovensis TaxID=278991 RepID=UPI00040155E0|nr:PilZ domain-containing protein [Aneurinibacillus terranovensis]
MPEEEEKRNFFRQQFPEPLEANAQIVRIREKEVETNILTALILDMSAGGLRFRTHLSFPVTPLVLFNFDIKVLDRIVTVCGSIVRKEEIEKDMFEYGLQFSIDEHKREEITQLLNRLSIRRRRGK